jgi:glutamate N-acetyltransferase / amino-acid N-acetyltransferase
MATMLSFIVTDAKVSPAALRAALKETVRTSFNRVTIDGDMSTNDTVLIMANGAAGNETIKSGTGDFVAFMKALSEVTYELAVMIAKDGEGMTKLLIVEVKNAKSEKEAEKAAFAIANSLLVKTAVYGNDANWGRILAAIGYSGITIKEEKVDVYLNGLRVARNGMAAGVDAEANDRLKAKEVVITADLHLGKGAAKVLSCDLTEDYIKINAEYRT